MLLYLPFNSGSLSSPWHSKKDLYNSASLLTPPVFCLAPVTFTLYAKAIWDYLKFSNYAVLPLTSGSFHMQISCSGMFFLLLTWLTHIHSALIFTVTFSDKHSLMPEVWAKFSFSLNTVTEIC